MKANILLSSLLLPAALLAQTPRTHYIFPSPLFIPATGPFAGKGAFAIIISDNPAAVQHCTTQATVTPDPSGQVKVDPLNVSFTGGSYWFDVTVTTGQLTQFTLPVTWRHGCGSAARSASSERNADPVFSVIINSSIVIALANATGTAASSPNAPPVSDPVSTASGELYGFDDSADLSLGGPLPLEFRRYYGSLMSSLGRPGPMATNWMHNFETRLTRADTRAIVTLFRGKTVRFELSGSNWQLGPGEQRPYQLVSTQSGYQFLDPASNLVYTFNAAGGLIRVEDRNGNAHTVTQTNSGITQIEDGLGRLLKFTYSGSPANLARVEDQTGRAVSFTYGAGNVLRTAVDALGKTTTYNYTSAGTRAALMTSAVLPRGNTPYTQEYDSSGRVTRQIDSHGAATQVAFGAQETTSVSDALGAVARFTYGLPGAVTRFVDQLGRAATYEYDASNRVTTEINRRGGRTVTAYHAASGLPASIADAVGGVTGFTYAPQSQGGFTYFVLMRVTFPDGATESHEYDARGNRTGFTDRAGKATAYTYNSRGQILTIRNPAGGVTTYTYNADGTVATVTAPSGDRITYNYDPLKRLSTETLADGSTRQYTYDARDRLLTFTDERGKRTTYAYDDNGNLATVTGPANQITRFAYSTQDRLTTVTDPLGRASSQTYDQLGRVASATNGAGEVESYKYDATGNRAEIADAAGRRLALAYDPEGAVAAATDGDSKTTAFTLDSLGRTSASVDPLAARTTFGYDAAGRLASITDPLGELTQFSYDPRGLPSAIALPQNITASFTLNDLGRIVSVVDPNGNGWLRVFDSSGRETSRTDPLGRATSYSYDNRQRVRQATLPEGALTLSYDAAGNVTSRQYSDGTRIAYVYDDNNRVTAATDVALAYDENGRINSSNGLLIARDAAGRIASVTYAPGKIVTYEYNAQGLIARIRDWVGGATDFTYDGARRLASARRPNGVVSQLAYDAAGRLASSTWSGGATSASIRITRDAAGRITQAIRALPRAADLGQGSNQFAYDAAHQLSGYTHDRMGRVVSGGGRTHVWNLASRMVSLEDRSGSSNFRYDAFGQMVAGRRNYVWNYALPLPSIAIARVAQADERYYVHMPSGQLLYSIEAAGNARRYYHFDEAGSTAFLTGDAGEVTDSYSITPYGEVVSRAGSTDNPFTFLGAYGVMQIGDSGLYYMRARFYDAVTARFLSHDPVRLLDPRAINPYQYALANPLGFIDATGAAPQQSQAAQPSPALLYAARPGLSPQLGFRYTRPAAAPGPAPGINPQTGAFIIPSEPSPEVADRLVARYREQSRINRQHLEQFFTQALFGALPGDLLDSGFNLVIPPLTPSLDLGAPAGPSYLQYVANQVVVV